MRLLLQERGAGKLHEEEENERIYQNEMNSSEFVMINGGFNLCDENSCKCIRKSMSSISDNFNNEIK